MKTPTEIVPAGLSRLIIQANDLLIQANRLRDPPRLTLFDSDQNSVLFVFDSHQKSLEQNWIKRRFIYLCSLQYSGSSASLLQSAAPYPA